MESQPQSDKPIRILTVADLEAIIVKIVQKVLEQEIGTLEQHRDLQEVETVENYLPKALLDTFGT